MIMTRSLVSFLQTLLLCQFFPLIDSLCHAVLMTDPAVGYLPGENYGPYDRGTEMDVWIKAPNGSASLGLVWPGVTVFPGL